MQPAAVQRIARLSGGVVSNTDGLNLLINVRSNGDRFYARMELSEDLCRLTQKAIPIFVTLR